MVSNPAQSACPSCPSGSKDPPAVLPGSSSPTMARRLSPITRPRPSADSSALASDQPSPPFQPLKPSPTPTFGHSLGTASLPSSLSQSRKRSAPAPLKLQPALLPPVPPRSSFRHQSHQSHPEQLLVSELSSGPFSPIEPDEGSSHPLMAHHRSPDPSFVVDSQPGNFALDPSQSQVQTGPSQTVLRHHCHIRQSNPKSPLAHSSINVSPPPSSLPCSTVADLDLSEIAATDVHYSDPGSNIGPPSSAPSAILEKETPWMSAYDLRSPQAPSNIADNSHRSSANSRDRHTSLSQAISSTRNRSYESPPMSATHGLYGGSQHGQPSSLSEVAQVDTPMTQHRPKDNLTAFSALTHALSGTAESIQSPICSPVSVDRTRLIGLGELATPKWSSNIIKATALNRYPQQTGKPVSREGSSEGGTGEMEGNIYSEPELARGSNPLTQADVKRVREWSSVLGCSNNSEFQSPLATSDERISHADQRIPQDSSNNFDPHLFSSPICQAGSGLFSNNQSEVQSSRRMKDRSESSGARASDFVSWTRTSSKTTTADRAPPGVSQTVSQSAFMNKLALELLPTRQKLPAPQGTSNNSSVGRSSISGRDCDLKPQDDPTSPASLLSSTSEEYHSNSIPNSARWSSNYSISKLPSIRSADSTDDIKPQTMKHKSTVASPLGNEHFNLDSTLDFQAHSQTFREQSQESSLPGTDYEIAPSKKNRAVHNQSSNFSNLKLSHSHQQELCSPSSPLNSQSSRFPPTSPSKVPSSAPQLPHHHHSPSTIAQFILKSASSGLASRSLETLDMEQVAAKNDDTAEALRKLDGLSTISVSPKVSRHLVKEYGVLANHASSGSNPGTVIQSRRSTASRPSSTSSSTGKERVSIKDRHKVSDDQVSVSSKKSRSRSIASAKESVSAVASQTEDYSVADQIAEMACQQSPAVARRLSFKLPQASTVGLPSTTYSSFSTHSSSKGVEGSGSSSSSPKTFYNSTTTSGSNGGVSRRASHSKQGPQPVQVEPNSVIGVSSFSGGPSDTSNAAFLNTGKRGSSSSTNYTGGTQSTGTTLDSRDSSLATSVSATASLPHHQVNYSSANGQITTNRSSNTSKSRNSAGSEASLVFSAGLNEQGRNNESSNLGPSKCESGEGMHIPPVPPLPKDYEPYKASNYGSSQIQYPPHSTSQIKNSSTKADNQPPDSHLLLKVNTATSTLNLASSNPSSPPGGLVATSSSSTSATSRFLHSLSSHKTSEDSINSSATHITNSGSGTSVSSKSTKKWSLSAALGIGKVPSFTKDNSHEEGARLPSAISSVSNQRFECRVSSSGSKKDFVDEVNANESNQNYSMGSQASKHSPLVSTTIQSPLHSHPASPVLTEKLTLNTSSSSVSTGETRASALPTNKSGLGSALSSRRTPSGIPFFSRKSSANNSGVAPGKLSISQPLACDESQSSSSFKIKSPRLLEKGDGEGGGRKSILALNAFIRNSVQRKPNLPSQTKEASSIPASSSFSSHVKVNQSPQSARNSEKSSIDKTSGTSHHRKKLSINLSHGGGGCKEPFAETNSPVKKHTFGTKASSLITRKRGKTVSATEFTKDSLLPPLPPLQMSAIHPTTTQRFESTSSLHAYNSSPSNPPKRQSGDFTHSASFSTRGTRVRTLRESTTSLRKAMPTIDASPHGKNARDEPVKQSTSLQHFDSNTDLRKSQVSKENISVHQVSDTTDTPILSRVSPRQTNPPCSVTPTKIPRAVFRSQKNTSPALKSRISDNHLSLKSDINLTPNGSKDLLSPAKEGQDESMLEDFGILSTRTSSLQCSAVNKRGPEAATGLGNSMIPRTRSRGSISGKPVQRASNNDLKVDSSFHIKDSSTAMTNEEQNQAQRSRNHGSLTIHGSPSSALSAAARLAAARRTVARTQESQAARVSSRRQSTHSTIHPSSNLADQSGVSEFGASETSGLQSSRSSRTLGSKLNLPSRISRSSTTSSVIGLMETNVAPTASRLSSAHDNQSPSSLRGRSPQMSDEETKGDEEMKQYVTRQRNKKLMSGMTSSEIDKLFEFPKAIEPVKAMTNQEALKLYKSYLSDYEKGEILEYQEIYYVGAESEKKMCQGISSTLDPRTGEKIFNYGYDDERGDYQIVKNDHLCFRYEVIDLLGKGSFGQVLECRDHKTGEMVAVKIIRNKKRFHHQALVEIKVLENLLKWDPDDRHCVLKMMDHFSFRGHLCIVNELLSINLYELIRNNSFNGFSVGLIKRFTTQILMSLSLLRHHRVVHCDLKPENILLKHPEKSAIKTIDFGSSCFENEKVYTYIQSRFYRSPEVILGMNYHMAIDMWSLGCILAELYTGYPIFPGETESEQLACIMEVLGMPDKYLVDRSSRRKLFFDSSGAPRPVVNSKGRRRRVGSKTLQSVLKADDELFVDFIAKCLAWDPERRLKPDPAMRHPWILAGRGSSRPSMSTTFSHSSISSRLANRSTTSGISISSPRRKTMQATSNSSCTSGLTQSNSSVILGTNSSISSSIGNTTNSFRLRAQSNAHRQILKNVQPHQSSATSGGAAGDSILRQSLPLKAGP